MIKELCIGLILLMILSGCSPQEIDIEKRTDVIEQIERKNITLNWMGHWNNEYSRGKLVEDIKKEYETKNPGIKINLQYPTVIFKGIDKDIYETVANSITETILTEDHKWDIVWLDPDLYARVAKQLDDTEWGEKYLVDFNSVEDFREVHEDFILDDPIYREQTGGILTGPYIEGFYAILWFNKDLADMIGIEIKQYGMTFNDLLSYVKAVDDYNREHGTDIAALQSSNNWMVNEYLFHNLIINEISDFKEVKENGRTPKKDAALLKAFQAFEQLSQYSPLPEDYDEYDWLTARSQPLDDKVLFSSGGSWMYTHWMYLSPEKTAKMIPAELPVFSEAYHYIGSFIPTFAVIKDSPNVNEAIDLVMTWTQPQIAEKWVRSTKCPTAIKGHLSKVDIGGDMYSTFNREIKSKYRERIFAASDQPGYIFGEDKNLRYELGGVMDDVLDGQKTAQQAYDEIMALAEE